MTWISAWWQQVSATVAQGLEITIVGMALVFLTLGLIIIALVLLTRLPGLRVVQQREEPAKPVSAAVPAPPPQRNAAVAQENQELERVAAIAVALLRTRRSALRSPSREQSPSRWKQYGRAHQLGL